MESNRYLSWYAAEYINDDIWISDIQFNGLFRIDWITGGCEFVGKFPNYSNDARELHLCTDRYENKLFFYPQHAPTIDIYDMQERRFYQANGFVGRENGFSTIISAIRFDEDVALLIPRYYDMPLQYFSLKEDAVIDVVELNQIRNSINNLNGFLTLYSCKETDNIIFPIYETNKIGSYNPKRKEEEIYELSQIEKIDGAIAFDGANIWLNADRGIYCWDKSNNEMELVCAATKKADNWIETIQLYKDKIVCIPRWLDDITVIDMKTREPDIYTIESEMLCEKMDYIWRDFKQSIIREDILMLSPLRYKEMILLNLRNRTVKVKKYKYPFDFHPYEKQLVTERNVNDLRTFLSFI